MTRLTSPAEIEAAGRESAQTAPPLRDEQVARLRVLLAPSQPERRAS